MKKKLGMGHCSSEFNVALMLTKGPFGVNPGDLNWTLSFAGSLGPL